MVGIGVTYNLPDLFSAVFGIRHYKIDTKEKQERMPAFQIDGYAVAPVKVRDSYLGTPVLTNIVFEGMEYKLFDKDGNIVKKSYDDFELPVATLVSIRRAKRIIKTAVNAGNGTVKELYGFGDWQIDINGFCIPDPNQPQGKTTPEAQRDELYRWEKIADAIRIKGGLNIHKDIHNIVIEEFNTWQLKGSPDIIPFRMKAVSDEPVELLLL